MDGVDRMIQLGKIEVLKEDNVHLLQTIAHLNNRITELEQENSRLIAKVVKYKSPPDDSDLAVVVDNAMKEYCETYPEGKWASSTEVAMLVHRYLQDYRIALKEGDLSKEDFVDEDLEAEE